MPLVERQHSIRVVPLSQHHDRATVLNGSDDEKKNYHLGQIDLLVPLVKAYGSDQAFRICETAIQTFGAAVKVATCQR